MHAQKAYVSAVLLLFSAGTVLTHLSPGVYPTLQVTFFAILLVTVYAVRYDFYHGYYLFGVITGATSARVYQAFVAGGQIAIDTNTYVYWSSRIVETGTLQPIDSGFYNLFAVFHALSSVFGLISGLPADYALVVYPIAGGVVLPTVAYATTSRIEGQRSVSAVLAAVIASCLAMGFKFSIAAIPQTYAIYVVSSFVLASFVYLSNPRPRTSLLLLVLLCGVLMSHKLPLFFLFGSIVTFAILLFLGRVDWSSIAPDSVRELRTLGATVFTLIGVMLLVQWGLVSHFVVGAIGYAISFGNQILALGVDTGADGTTFIEVTHATRFVRSNVLPASDALISILALAVVGWLFAYWYYDDIQARMVLAASGVAGGLTLVGIISRLSVQRTLLIGEVFFAVLCGLLFAHLLSSKRYRVIGAVVLVLFISAQVFSPYAALDHPEKVREHLTDAESEGKLFADKHVRGPLYMDLFGATKEMIHADQPRRYRPMEVAYLNKNVSSETHRSVSVRTAEDIYLVWDPRIPHSLWTLDWNPEREFDGEYHRVYDNGGFVTYTANDRENRPNGTGE